MNSKKRVLVTGAGGFIGHHLVRFLKLKGYWVRGVDVKYPEFSAKDEADEFFLLDLREYKNAITSTEGIQHVYNLAGNMGGIGYIETVNASVMRDNVLINVNIAESSRINKVERIFFSSSACVYSHAITSNPNSPALKESDAYPANPSNEYAWEKLFSERLYTNYYKDYGIEARIARFHTIYGPEAEYKGGREKAPLALSYKMASAKDGEEMEIWGDGKQTRTFCYIDDCLRGIYDLMSSDYREPLNIGSDELISISDLVDLLSKISNKKIVKKYLLDKPQGVRGRNSDNTLVKKILHWEPKISLEDGFRKTYEWVSKQPK